MEVEPRGGRAESRKEHWKLLGNLKTTVEGLVSTSNPNVWSKYGGLERLCRDMHSILYHGLIHDKVYCRQKDYWQFVKDIRRLSPSSAHHLEKFISLHENGQPGPDSHSDQAIAQLWLQHSLQFHCLSAQLKPLLGNRQYIRKFYADTAFLLSDAHVTAMLQCLEAVEQNNPRLLAQIDTSMLTRKGEGLSPVTKSQSLTALPGSFYTLSPGCPQQHHCGSFSSLPHPASSGLPGGLRDITIIIEDPVAESHADTGGGRGTVSGSTQSSELSTPSSLYMEYDSNQYLSSGEGMFRRPSEGQSLISYLSEQDFGSCADLEKENAHFSISESLIAAIELMKCNMMSRQLEEEEEDSDKEIQELKQKIRIRRQQIRTKHLFSTCQEIGSDSLVVTDSESQFSSHGSMRLSDSGSAEDVEEYEIRDADIKRNPDSSRKPFLTSESISHSFGNSNSAEAVAMGLLKQFEGMQLPAASELEWLVPEHDAPQKLLPIPDSLPVSPDDGEHADIYKLRIRVRGNLEWAPPRPQIIFNVHPAPTRKVAVAKQNYRCAGCGIRTDPDYIKRLRYCEYLGKYFCQCCHENAQTVIPSRILRKWDFSKYYVSNFSKDLLSKIWSDPLFNVQDINPALYRKVKSLNQVWLLRIQLFHMKNMFKTCRLAKDLLDSFDAVPGHLTEDLHLYSLSDLSATKRGDLVPRLTELLKAGSLHVEKCMLCQAKGFICEFCQNEGDIIFPFELNKCKTCEECKACYHKSCFKSTHCPRCERLQARRELLAKQSMESYISDYEDDELEQQEAATAT
ncbi:UNVERIFIED_CONTAM: hypothetical protein H355_001299 [Colinus virginianus]|nr:hypothetical protein H355_001299 [Colinus virginianus]